MPGADRKRSRRAGLRVAMLLHKSVEHDSRVRREARALQLAGHEVTVVHLPPERGWLDGELDRFRVVSATPPSWVRRRIPFPAYRAVFLAAFVRELIRLRPDVVHAHDAAMLLPGYLGARLTGARLVYDSHELATGVPYRERGWASFVSELERFVVPRCAGVVTVSDGIAARLQELYALARRPTVVRNVPDLGVEHAPALAGPRSDGPMRQRLGLATAPLVLHQGALAPRRGCDTAVRALTELPDDVALVFLGDAWPGYAGEVERLAAELGLAGRVHLLPSVPVEELLAWTRDADVGLSLLQGDSDNHRLALPNKVFEYVAAGVPVVVSDLPELRALVDTHGIGVCCDPASPADLAAAIRDVLARRDELTPVVAIAGRSLTWVAESRQLTALYGRLAGHRGERALVLVRNGCSHDARVLREAGTLQRLRYDPLVVGVVTGRERRPEENVDGVAIRRLDPGGSMRKLLRLRSWDSRDGAAGAVADPRASKPSADGAARTPLARLRRLLVTLDWYRQASAVVRRERPALIHCNDFNTMWIGVVAKVTGRRRVVYDAHELWPDRNLRPEPRWWLLACEWLFVRIADEVLTTSPAYADVMANRYGIERPTVVRNVPEFTVVPRADDDVPADPPGRPPLAVYFGAVTRGRGLEVAIAALREVAGLKLRIVGPDAWGFRAVLADTARRLEVEDRVELLEPVSPSDAPALFADADLGLALIEPVCLSYRLTLPNKLFEYMAAGLPVLASDLPAISELLAETGAGITVDRVEAASVAAGLCTAIEPCRNAALRAAALAAARVVTWEAERDVLSRAYDHAMGAAQ
jgi:glycosyltransferase involved in cell wall biosynthesis